jgi:phosphohistidine phosphatase SixA
MKPAPRRAPGLTRRGGLGLAAAFLLAASPSAASEEAAWSALRDGGVVALMRHARAPGMGDPPTFRLGDCTTQRNLSEAGRDQASRLGARFRAERVPVAGVRSSRWCRALDTATLAFPQLIVEPHATLDSFFGDSGAGAEQTARARAMVDDWRSRQGTLALVTHQVNMTALTGIFPAEGEIVVLRPKPGAGFEVVGSVKP